MINVARAGLVKRQGYGLAGIVTDAARRDGAGAVKGAGYAGKASRVNSGDAIKAYQAVVR